MRRWSVGALLLAALAAVAVAVIVPGSVVHPSVARADCRQTPFQPAGAGGMRADDDSACCPPASSVSADTRRSRATTRDPEARRAGVRTSPTAHTASSRSPSFVYETLYAGTFTYSSYVCTSAGVTDRVNTTYNFQIVDDDIYSRISDSQVREQLRVAATATGGTSETKADQGETTYQQICTDVNLPGKKYTASRTLRKGVGPEPPEDSSDYYVYWVLPWRTDSHSVYYFDGVPDGAPGVTMNCTQYQSGSATQRFQAPDGASLVSNYDKTIALQWQNHELPACGGDYLTPTDEFFQLWDSDTRVPRSQQTYERNFAFSKAISGSLADDPDSVCAYSVNYQTHLRFSPIKIPGAPPPPSEPSKPTKPTKPHEPKRPGVYVPPYTPGQRVVIFNKVGALLADDWEFLLGGGSGLRGTPATGGSVAVPPGQNVEVLYPGMPVDGVGTVNAHIVPGGGAADLVSGHGHARAASADIPLLSGSFSAQADTPTPVTLHLTSAGRTYIADHPGAIRLRFVATFTAKDIPKITRTGTATIPAAG